MRASELIAVVLLPYLADAQGPCSCTTLRVSGAENQQSSYMGLYELSSIDYGPKSVFMKAGVDGTFGRHCRLPSRSQVGD